MSGASGALMGQKRFDLSFLKKNIAIILLIVLVVFNCIFTKNFMSWVTFSNLFMQASKIALIGLGMTLVIATVSYTHLCIAVNRLRALWAGAILLCPAALAGDRYSNLFLPFPGRLSACTVPLPFFARYLQSAGARW